MDLTVNSNNAAAAKSFLKKVVAAGIDFKTRKKFLDRSIDYEKSRRLLGNIPERGIGLDSLLKKVKKDVLPYCTNFSSPGFMGFPDSGNSIAALGGAVLKELVQQNLINQSFCAPIATFFDVAVISWMRDLLGYKDKAIKNDIWDVGGIVTASGTMSNATAMMLARENKYPETMVSGVRQSQGCFVVVPKGLSHYSIKSSLMWIGCGSKIIEVPTRDYKYDLKALEDVIKKHNKKIMAIVAYAGDSRTMSVDNFAAIHRIAKKHKCRAWLHADACHGFSLGFSHKYKKLLKGINLFDSITLDPHKVLATPYTVSLLLVKDPLGMKSITTTSDLIMQEDFAFGQITPFVGSRQWESLKLWFMMNNFGRRGLDKLITDRCDLARYLHGRLKSDGNFAVLNEPEINSVMFVYLGKNDQSDIENVNKMNMAIHDRLLRDGRYHLHQFRFHVDDFFGKSAVLYPLRYMAGNPNITEGDIDRMLAYLKDVAAKLGF